MMKNKNWYSYVKSKNLINRIYNMLEYFNFFQRRNINSKYARVYIKANIGDICFVETLSKYFDEKLKKNRKMVELRCNLSDLINDLDFLKQYLEK